MLVSHHLLYSLNDPALSYHNLLSECRDAGRGYDESTLFSAPHHMCNGDLSSQFQGNHDHRPHCRTSSQFPTQQQLPQHFPVPPPIAADMDTTAAH